MRTVVGLAAVILLFVAGCAATERMAVKESPTVCAFLGNDTCVHLKPGARGEAGLRYVNPKAQFTNYKKVMPETVGFFGSDAAKVAPKEQQTLTDYVHKALNEALAKKFQVVDQPGPGVARIQVAVLDAEAATAGARSVSMAIPQARILSLGYYAVAGKYPFTGGGEAAVKITDAETGQVLAAAADRRVGGGSIETAAQWQWGDAENVIKKWAEMITNGLYAYTSGERKP